MLKNMDSADARNLLSLADYLVSRQEVRNSRNIIQFAHIEN